MLGIPIPHLRGVRGVVGWMFSDFRMRWKRRHGRRPVVVVVADSTNARMYRKMLRTARTLVHPKSERGSVEVFPEGKRLRATIQRLFHGSLAIRVVTAGSTNACEQELVALGNTTYDAERFGVRFVASPRHADMLMVTGPVSRNMREALVRTWNAMPEPKFAVTVGDDAHDGGIFRGSYAVCDGAKDIIPVHYHIPGDPPSPTAILRALLAILTDVEAKRNTRRV